MGLWLPGPGILCQKVGNYAVYHFLPHAHAWTNILCLCTVNFKVNFNINFFVIILHHIYQT